MEHYSQISKQLMLSTIFINFLQWSQMEHYSQISKQLMLSTIFINWLLMTVMTLMSRYWVTLHLLFYGYLVYWAAISTQFGINGIETDSSAWWEHYTVVQYPSLGYLLTCIEPAFVHIKLWPLLNVDILCNKSWLGIGSRPLVYKDWSISPF